MDAFVPLARLLHERGVRYVVMGVWGANYYARSASTVFTTEDRDLFLPPDADNLVLCWAACEALGLDLWCGNEPLDMPRDRWLAEQMIGQRAAVKASDGSELDVDLSLVMASFDFEAVWNERRVFTMDGADIPVARLLHIVQSKHAVGRDKDRLFLATHRDALRELLERENRRKP